MSAQVINKPFPHCAIPYGHPCFRGYVPAEFTDIRQTWAYITHGCHAVGDDYDHNTRTDHMSAPGGWK